MGEEKDKGKQLLPSLDEKHRERDCVREEERLEVEQKQSSDSSVRRLGMGEDLGARVRTIYTSALGLG
jgi:hypothetical protein